MKASDPTPDFLRVRSAAEIDNLTGEETLSARFPIVQLMALESFGLVRPAALTTEGQIL